jgi:hypothetical protein
MTAPLLTQAGAYADISSQEYHRNANLLPGPSLSSSGAKTILSKSPLHYFHDSPLNPNRPPEADKPHFSLGRACHDAILLPDTFRNHYFVTTEGFSRAKTKAMADEIAEADAALKSGMTVLTFEQHEALKAMVASIKTNSLAVATLTNGVAEETLVWQDPLTGLWLRARPDFRPHSLLEKRKVMAVPDLKFVAPAHASKDGFSRAINNFGYHQSAAWYSDGIHAVYDVRPTNWLHVVVEKEPPYCVALYELPAEDIQRGRLLNRRAIAIYERCLKTGKWPGYADEPAEVGLPIYARMQIEEQSTAEHIMADAG